MLGIPPWTIVPVIAGAVTAAFGLVTWFVNGVRTERTRLQKLYADAYSAVISYQEFPYAIRRRRAPSQEQEQLGNEERLRISTALHTVQESLNNYLAQISTKSQPVYERYAKLVAETRRVAGTYMHEAWHAPPLDNDPGMNISVIYSDLTEPQQKYLEAVKSDMTFWRIAIPYIRKD
ncbi:MAG TPA: hypothetical protein VK691_07650 [Solirubrobacteraceae bacterium]|nr:hypothetical protein [Solirubrobacteraceae bacterium]